MAPPEHEPDADLPLLELDRELNQEEMAVLAQLAQDAWTSIGKLLSLKARRVYAAADPHDFADCCANHLSTAEETAMYAAETFSCPRCGRLLKDRHGGQR